MFGSSKKKRQDTAIQTGSLQVIAADTLNLDEDFKPQLGQAVGQLPVSFHADASMIDIAKAEAVLALFPDTVVLDRLAAQVRQERSRRKNGLPVLIVAIGTRRLTEFGAWLHAQAVAEAISGLRLILGNDLQEIAAQVAQRLGPVHEINIIKMPVSTEVDHPEYKYFYCLSPKLRATLSHLEGLAANNITRIYLLGGPGAGKTSLAYYYYLCRGRGKFVTANLTAESTGDKAQMKSLLCGHVSGAFPGAGSRTGTFTHARDGVAFLDESHGVTGVVMEVLMEALDNNQYLPLGASAKRPLECAVVFASNRNWDTLVQSINLDEHARLGASIMHLADLSQRQEDLIAVMVDHFNRLASQCTTWTPPVGLSDAAWATLRDWPWYGNTRALIRVVETAFVAAASGSDSVIDENLVRDALKLWEPVEHQSHDIYSRSR